MPHTPHAEKHFTASETVQDIVIGMSDGLTVPFARAAALSGAVEASLPPLACARKASTPLEPPSDRFCYF